MNAAQIAPRLVAALVTLGLLLGACGSSGEDSEAASNAVPTIIASTSIWADVVSNVACDGAAAVSALIPAGADPHVFEPSLADRADLEGAALVVANGLGLEEGLEDTIQAVESDGTPVFWVADSIAAIEYADGGADPHFWLDPTRVAAMLPTLADTLVTEAGIESAVVADCVSSYQKQLEELDATLVEGLEEVPVGSRKLVTNHDSLGYFADRFGFEVVGTVIPASSGLAETNPAQLAQLAERLEELEVNAVFIETQHSSDAAVALADSLEGVEVVTLFTGTLGEPGSGAETYIAMLAANVDLIVASLS